MYVEGQVRSYAAAVGLSRWAMIGFPPLWYKGTCNKTPRLEGMVERDDDHQRKLYPYMNEACHQAPSVSSNTR